MKILVNCYACSPYKGSEPGMGWNFVRCLSKKHELHIITESKFQPDLVKYFTEHPEEKKDYHFYFIQKERHKRLRKIWPPSYYWYYRKWQRKALELALELDAKEHFDLVHQLNMIGYREPGYLWMMDKPVIWGPIGGFNITPWRFLPSLGLKGMLFYGFRNLINMWQMRYTRRIREAARRCSSIISATQDSYDVVTKIWKRESIIIPEVGLLEQTVHNNVTIRQGRFKICWAGLLIPRKSLNLLLDAMTLSSHKESMTLDVLGDGECRKKWQLKAKQNGLININWHGQVSHEEAIRMMEQSDMFVITSLSDATSTVLLEALSMGKPIIALNHLGFANVLTDKCGVKINVHNPSQVIKDYAKALDLMYEDTDKRKTLSNGAFERAKEFSWGKKAEMIDEIYRKVINS